MKLRRRKRPRQPPRRVLRLLVEARSDGLTLRQCAAQAGVHIATVCRWQARDPAFYAEMREAERWHAIFRYRWAPRRRPRVPWRRDCPRCGGEVVVRKAPAKLTFWGCPQCCWASWRPRAPADCLACGGPRFWSHSRKSIACRDCGRREAWPG
jgi:hypothetical protein